MTKRRILTTSIIATLLAFLLFAGLAGPRSTPGRILRFIRGSPGAVQWVEDLVVDVQSLEDPSQLRLWAQDVMDKYRAGEISTNESPNYWAQGQVVVPQEDIPEWLQKKFGQPMYTQPPQITICVAKYDRKPICVVWAWYLKGLVISGTNNATMDFTPFCKKEAAQGIFAYSVEK